MCTQQTHSRHTGGTRKIENLNIWIPNHISDRKKVRSRIDMLLLWKLKNEDRLSTKSCNFKRPDDEPRRRSQSITFKTFQCYWIFLVVFYFFRSSLHASKFVAFLNWKLSNSKIGTDWEVLNVYIRRSIFWKNNYLALKLYRVIWTSK